MWNKNKEELKKNYVSLNHSLRKNTRASKGSKIITKGGLRKHKHSSKSHVRKRDPSKFRHVKSNIQAKLFRASRSNSVDLIDLRYHKRGKVISQERSSGSGFKMNISQSNCSMHYDEDLTTEFNQGISKRRSKIRTKRRKSKQETPSKESRSLKRRANYQQVPKILKIRKIKIKKYSQNDYSKDKSPYKSQ